MANVRRLPGSGELTRAQLPERTNTNPRARHPLLTMDASTRRRAFAWLGSEVVGEDFSVHAAIASAGGLPGVDAGWLGYSSRSALLYNTVSSNQSFFEAVKPALVPYELTEGYKHKFVRRVEYLSAVGGLRLPKTPTKGARPLYDEFRHSGQAFTDMFRFNVNVFDNKLYSYIENKLTAELRMPGIPWKVSPGFCTKDLALAALVTIGHDLSTVEMPAVTGFIGKSTNKKHTDMVVEALYQNAALQADVRLQFPDFREQADLSALVPDLPGCFGNIDGILNRLDKVHSLGEENKVGRKKGAYSALVSQAVFTPYGRCLLWAPGANCNIGDKAHSPTQRSLCCTASPTSSFLENGWLVMRATLGCSHSSEFPTQSRKSRGFLMECFSMGGSIRERKRWHTPCLTTRGCQDTVFRVRMGSDVCEIRF